jgi:hypothetical protein
MQKQKEPKNKVESLAQTFLLGAVEKYENEVPIVADENVEHGRSLNHEIQL